MQDSSIDEDAPAAAIATPCPSGLSRRQPAGSSVAPRRRTRSGAPPLNLRFSLPLLGSRFYFTMVGGRERRSRQRLAVERRNHPVATRSNVLFIVIGALTLYVVTLGAFLGWAALTGA